MKKKYALINTLIDLIFSISFILLGFISRGIFIHKMGAEAAGLLSLFTQLIGMLSLAEMGIGLASSKFLYGPLNSGSLEEISKIINGARRIYQYIALLIFIFGVVTGFIIYCLIPNVAQIHNSLILWFMFLLNSSISYLYADKITLLTADQKLYKARYVQGSAKLICTILQIFIILSLKSFILYLIVQLLFTFVQWIILTKIVNYSYPYTKFFTGRDYSVFSLMKQVFFHQLGNVLIFNTDYLVISFFMTLSAVTIYSNYIMIVLALSLISTSVCNGLTAGVGNYIINNNARAILDLWKKVIVVFFFLATIFAIVTYLTINDFITLWVGPNYLISNDTLIIIILNLYIMISRLSIDIFKIASGIFSDIYLPIIEGGGNLVLSIVLIKYFGLMGVALGTLISNVIICFSAKSIYLYIKLIGKRVDSFICYLLKNLLLSTIIAFICIYTKILFSPLPSNLYFWLLKVIYVGFITTAVSTVIFSLNKHFRFCIIDLYYFLKTKKGS